MFSAPKTIMSCSKKSWSNTWQVGIIALSLHIEKTTNLDTGSYRFDWDTHQIKTKTEKTSFANGGPQTFMVAGMPVDYKGKELSNLML